MNMSFKPELIRFSNGTTKMKACVRKAGNGTVQPVGFPIRTDPQPIFFTFRPLPITNGSTVSRPVPVFKQTVNTETFLFYSRANVVNL